ncbi:MAG: hypothetical protein V7459_07550 [Oceanicoccus sp.]
MSNQFLKEPLFHFLLAGLCLFVIFNWVSPAGNENDDKRITVNRDKLITYMQHKTKIYEPDKAQDLFDRLPIDKRDRLMEQYIRQEALYREAKALKLDKSDYTIRQRLIRQLEFINEGFIKASIDKSDDDLLRYLDDHQQRYLVTEKITFTHVFFSSDKHQGEHLQAAKLKLKELNDGEVSFHQALPHGDRFLYHRNYVEKKSAAIASHFGQKFQQQVFAITADDQRWQGPFLSPYGSHLVLVTKLTDSFLPPLNEIRSQVERDAIQDEVRSELEKINRSIIDTYDVDIADLD